MHFRELTVSVVFLFVSEFLSMMQFTTTTCPACSYTTTPCPASYIATPVQPLPPLSSKLHHHPCPYTTTPVQHAATLPPLSSMQLHYHPCPASYTATPVHTPPPLSIHYHPCPACSYTTTPCSASYTTTPCPATYLCIKQSNVVKTDFHITELSLAADYL